MEFSAEELSDLFDAIKESIETTENRLHNIRYRSDGTLYYAKLLDRNEKYLERLELIEQRLKVEIERLVRK